MGLKLRIIFFSVIVFTLSVKFSQNGYTAQNFFAQNFFGADSLFTKTDSVITSADSLAVILKRELAEGKGLYEKKCQKCHKLHKPKEFTLKLWKENLDEMKDKAELTKSEYKLILKYLSENCKK